jgi:GT2 family glycosyltransferase
VELLFTKRQTPDLADGCNIFGPIQVLQVELSQPLPDVMAFDVETGQCYQRTISLVRLRHQPLGVVELHLGENGINATDYARQIWHALGPEIKEYLLQHGVTEVAEFGAAGLTGVGSLGERQIQEPPLSNAPAVSVIVATHDRTSSLATCLQSLLLLRYPTYEILVVDNAPNSKATADYMRREYDNSSQVRYLLEDHPGLGAAHNRGLREVKNPIVAFTDDDVVVDRHWLTELVKGFSVAEDVACVTGMIFPIELETQSQIWTEQYWGLCKGFTRRVFDLDQNRPNTPLYPYTAGVFGSGANMAFRTSVLRRLGGFDAALGVGTIARGGDDLAAFFQVVSSGYKLVYQPAAIVYHQHRRDYDGLRRQAFGYGVGFTAYLTKSLLDRPTLLFDFISEAPYGLSYVLNFKSTKLAAYPRELKNLERKGMMYGPFAYLRSRWQCRKLRQQLGPVEEPKGLQGVSYE